LWQHGLKFTLAPHPNAAQIAGAAALGDVLKLGTVSLALVVVELAVAIAFMTALGRAFRLKPKVTSLLAVGSAVCGVSAIIATQGAIDADDEDASVTIAAILVLGALALVAFPLIGHLLGLSNHAYGIWAGLAVDNTAEATAAGALYSETAGKLAVLAQTTRNAMIGFVVLGYATYWASRGQAAAITDRGRFVWDCERISESSSRLAYDPSPSERSARSSSPRSPSGWWPRQTEWLAYDEASVNRRMDSVRRPAIAARRSLDCAT
jgi:hypothetical protein